MEDKYINLIFNNKALGRVAINPETTLQALLKTANEFMKSKGFIPERYSLRLFLDKTRVVPGQILYDPKYSTNKIYSQLETGYLYYILDNFSNLDRNVIINLTSKMDGITLTNLCQSSRRMYNLCSDETFWKQLVFFKYNVSNLGLYPAWKSLYLDSLDPKKEIKIYSLFTDKFISDIDMTLYTPLSLFLNKVAQKVIGEKGSFNYLTIVGNIPRYNYLDLKSLPSTIPRERIFVNYADLMLDRFPSILIGKQTFINPYMHLVNDKIVDFGLYMQSQKVINDEVIMENVIAKSDLKGGYTIVRGAEPLYDDEFYRKEIEKYQR